MKSEKICCTLCNSSNIIPTSNTIRNNTNPECKMYICKDCETHFMFPFMDSNALERYYDGDFRIETHTEIYYDKEKLDKVFERFTPEAKKRVQRIQSELNKEDDILEIGCSLGYFLSAIEPLVHTVCGTEWDSQARNYIKNELANSKIKVEKNPEDFNKKFDKIFLFHVLEHIADPVQYLINLKPFMKENAKVYIEVPNVDDIMVKTFHCDSFINFYYKKAHIYNFNEKGLRYIFELGKFDYNIQHIQRYDISNHFYWLANYAPGGNGAYKDIFPDSLMEEYKKALISSKQSDTLFATLQC